MGVRSHHTCAQKPHVAVSLLPSRRSLCRGLRDGVIQPHQFYNQLTPPPPPHPHLAPATLAFSLFCELLKHTQPGPASGPSCICPMLSQHLQGSQAYFLRFCANFISSGCLPQPRPLDANHPPFSPCSGFLYSTGHPLRQYLSVSFPSPENTHTLK